MPDQDPLLICQMLETIESHRQAARQKMDYAHQQIVEVVLPAIQAGRTEDDAQKAKIAELRKYLGCDEEPTY